MLDKVDLKVFSKKTQDRILWVLLNVPKIAGVIIMALLTIWIFSKSLNNFGFERTVVVQLSIIIFLWRRYFRFT